MHVDWVAIDAVDDKPVKAPLWARTAGVSDDGDVYLPAALAGSEMAVIITIGWSADSRILESKGHIYVPARILRRDFPQWAELFQRIENRIRKFVVDNA